MINLYFNEEAQAQAANDYADGVTDLTTALSRSEMVAGQARHFGI